MKFVGRRMNIFFINDVQNFQRREHIKKECNKIGIEPYFFGAVMGKNLSDEELREVTCSDWYLTRGEIGCVMSHKKVLEKFLETDEESVIIFEDDVCFAKELTKSILEKLNLFVAKTKAPSILALYTSEIVYEPCVNLDDITIYSTPRFMRSHAYIINRSAAQHVIDIQSPIWLEYDQFRYYYYLKGCNLYALDKNLVLVNEEELPSSIDVFVSEEISVKKRQFQNKYFIELLGKFSIIEKIMYLMRRCKKNVKSKKFLRYMDCTKR